MADEATAAGGAGDACGECQRPHLPRREYATTLRGR
eukprot:gene608-12573_t